MGGHLRELIFVGSGIMEKMRQSMRSAGRTKAVVTGITGVAIGVMALLNPATLILGIPGQVLVTMSFKWKEDDHKESVMRLYRETEKMLVELIFFNEKITASRL